MSTQEMARYMMYAGAGLLICGALLYVGSRFGLGRLPGDFSITRGGMKINFPLKSCIIVSIVLTVIMNIVSRR
jgi:hypothetical protein